MPYYTLRLNIPPNHQYGEEAWVESAIGNIVRPTVLKYSIKRFWFTRYGNLAKDGHLLFRFEHEDVGILRSYVLELCTDEGLTADFSIYDIDGDLGGDRFRGEDSLQTDHRVRSQLVFNYLNGVAAMFVDCLVPVKDGSKRFRLEHSSHAQNPEGSIFESLHHLFCNTTNVRTPVYFVERNGTHFIESPLYYSYNQMQGDKVTKCYPSF